jgi:isoquinoline 1-oxidoreductase beta subunit
MTIMNQISRRQFIATSLTAAGGFALGIGIGGHAEAATLDVRPWSDDLPHAGEINAWVVINPDDSVIVRYGRAEMGQGSFTALPQILTEELECDWAFVKPEYASANRNLRDNKVYGSLSTGGSRAVRETGEMVQQAGASARERLIAAAAKRWNVPASDCAAATSKVTHKPTGRTFRYGELAVEAAAIKLDKEPAIKKPDQFKFIGKRLARLDVPLKINGTAKYGIDLDVPNMVHAAIIACPVRCGDRRPALARAGRPRRAEDRVGGRRVRLNRQRAVPQGLS